MNVEKTVFIFAAIFVLFFTIEAQGAPFEPKDEINAQMQIGALESNQRAEALFAQIRFQKLYERLSQVGNKRLLASYKDFQIARTIVVLDADESAGTIDANIHLIIKSYASDLSEVSFAMGSLGDIGATDSDSNPLQFEYDSNSSLITVHLPAPVPADSEYEIILHNAGAPDCSPDANFGMTMCQVSEEIVFFAFNDWIPTKAVFDYIDLYSCGPTDFDITTPPGYVAATTSDLDSVEDKGDYLIHHFKGKYSSAYVALAYAKFNTFEAKTDTGKPVKTYVHTSMTDFGQNWADICADVVDYYSGIYIPYLYNKHDAIQAIDELGGGVGPMAETFYAAFALEQDPAETYSEALFSHEIAHSWWANMIALGDMYSPWLSEGFAEYSSRLYGYTVWPKNYQDHLYEMYFRYFQYYSLGNYEVPMTSVQVINTDSMTYQAITYWKGAHVLRMLQWLIGDESFFKGIRQYASDYEWETQHKVIDVDAFKAEMEAASGMDLTTFFNQWVYDIGYPVYSWSAEFNETEDGYEVKVKVEQTQESGKLYELPIEVSIWVGSEEEPRYYRLEFIGTVAYEVYKFNKNEEPRGVKVDGSAWIWADKMHRLKGDVDSSNEIDGLDLIYVSWSQGGNTNSYRGIRNYIMSADTDRNGVIDEADLNVIKDNFGRKGKISDE